MSSHCIGGPDVVSGAGSAGAYESWGVTSASLLAMLGASGASGERSGASIVARSSEAVVAGGLSRVVLDPRRLQGFVVWGGGAVESK